jgi:hypothetical protein
MEFFFLPEREIPDIFFSTLTIEESFERPNFIKYRIRMDKDGEWVRRILQIIHDNPYPRQATPRPSRPTTVLKALGAVQHEPESIVTRTSMEQGLSDKKLTVGRGLYKESMTNGHRQFYSNIMLECAKRYVLLSKVLAQSFQ